MFEKIKNMFRIAINKKDEIFLNVVEEFTDSPGARYESEGAFSGARFRQELLYPLLSEALLYNEVLVVNLDGAYGYGTAFLDESFGGLIRNEMVPMDKIKKHLKIISNEEPGLVVEIENYLNKANEECSDG